MIFTTKGIVLRQVKYGETSVIVSIFTELFGIQSYLVNGVRTNSKNPKAVFLQPASILELEVYHNELKNLQRVREMKWAFLYKDVWQNVVKNGVALYMVELLQKCLKQPEANEELFHFCEQSLIELDRSSGTALANMPLLFNVRLANYFGFGIRDNYSVNCNVFHLAEGEFTQGDNADQRLTASPVMSEHIAHLLHMNTDTAADLKMNRSARYALLKCFEQYYAWHIADFGELKTLTVLPSLF